MDDASRRAYWRANVKLITGLLSVWAAVSFGAGVVLAPWLNQLFLGGAPLGFWVAQQGSIYLFVALIFYYAWRMEKIDARFHADSQD